MYRRRTTPLSVTQHVEVPCPHCGATVACTVQEGLFLELRTPCQHRCNLDEDYDRETLEERAVNAAIRQRHEAAEA